MYIYSKYISIYLSFKGTTIKFKLNIYQTILTQLILYTFLLKEKVSSKIKFINLNLNVMWAKGTKILRLKLLALTPIEASRG